MAVYCEKILTLCRWGCVRSVALRETLIRELGVDSIAAGIQKNSPETLKLLCDWADVIVVASEHLMKLEEAAVLPPGKTVVLNLGADVWQDARHKDLLQKSWKELRPLLKQIRHTRECNKPRSSRLG